MAQALKRFERMKNNPLLLALELTGLRAAEVTFALKVIDARWRVTPYEPIAGAGHAWGRRLALGLGASWRPR